MTQWLDRLNANPLDWLLAPDPVNPGVRYFALRDLLDRAADDPDVAAAQTAVMTTGPVPIILEAADPDGYWVKPKDIYNPKYQGTVWQIMFLAQFGCDGHEERVKKAVAYVIDRTRAKNGVFSYSGAPSGAIHCMWGNLVRALIDLGCWGDERLTQAADLLARSITGDGYEHYYKSGIQAPGFLCSASYGLPCGWGAVRVLWGLNGIPSADRSPTISTAIEACIEFLTRYDISRADYPHQDRVSSSWFKFGYPLGYVTDVLLNLDVLTEAGVVSGPNIDAAVDFVLSKQDEQGRWRLEYTYNGKTWIDVETKGQPSKWVTLRALRVLKRLGVN